MQCLQCVNLPHMDYLANIFIPTGNRRLNELIGFLMCVSALLLFLALVSYSPLDPSWNSASVLTGSHAARNWIGVVGAFTADMMLQFFGIGAFLLVIFPAMLGVRWFRSMKVRSPLAKSLGGIWLLMFVPAMLALLPGHFRWMGVIPIEGLLGRVVGDVLMHYLNVVGAYIVCATVLAVAMYLSTAFSFAAIRIWAPTHFAFVTALWNRYKDWQQERTKKRQQKELEQRRISKPVVKTQLIPSRPAGQAPAVSEPRRTGIERMMAEEGAPKAAAARVFSAAATTAGQAESCPSLHQELSLNRQPIPKSLSAPTAETKPRRRCRASPADTSCRRAACCSVLMSNRQSMPMNSNSWPKC